MKPFLSIIIPCHNGESFAERCISSVLPQITDECELFLVDDGSTDKTSRIFENYSADNVHILHVSCLCPAEARNTAIRKAKGEYCWCVDSDDYIEANAVSVIIKALKESKPDILRFRYYKDDNGSSQLIEAPFKEGTYSGEALSEIKHYAVGFSDSAPFFIWLHVYRTELLKTVPLLPLKTHLSECNSLAQRIYPRANKICFIDDALYHYVIRHDSLSFNPIPYSYQALNRFRAVRDDLTSIGVYDEYRADLVFCIMDRLFLGLFKKEKCVFMTEYLLCDNLETAHAHVKDILAQPDFKELLAEAKKRKVAPTVALCYRVMEEENEDALYKIIRAFL